MADRCDEDTYLRVKDVAALLGVSVPTVWRWAREGRMPKPFSLGPSTTVWSRAELNAWIEHAMQERSARG